MLRKVLVTMVGHVDHGKSTILDKIRGSTVVEREAGKITQAIGASIIPIETIKRVCGKLLDDLKLKVTIPGILAIDTPGHEAFTNLRRRGGSLADIAVLVVDIKEGFKPQTLEAIEILKDSKTPFIVAANKIDLISGWQSNKCFLIEDISKQGENVRKELDKKIYSLVGKISELGFDSERFDKVDNFTKQIAIVPVSGKTGEGIPELLMVLTGLAQRFLEKSLKCDVKGYAKGTILEVKEEKGIGATIDVIIYDGKLGINDTVVIGGVKKPVVTKVKILLEPMPLHEMRDKKSKYKHVKSITAATGVKISAPGVEDAIAGMPLQGCNKKDVKKVQEDIQKQVREIIIETDKHGIVIKADSLGSLEALTTLLRNKGTEIKKASVGNITKKDIADAQANYEKDPLKAIVLGFNVKDETKKKENVKVMMNNVIYKLIEDFEEWQSKAKSEIEGKKLEKVKRPFKIKLLAGYVFRQNNPAVVGVEVLAGTLKTSVGVMKDDGKELTDVKSIQMENKNIEKAEKGKQVAVSMDKVTVGRQINENDVLYSFIPENDFRKLKELKEYLSDDEKVLLKEIAKIMRKDSPMWGI